MQEYHKCLILQEYVVRDTRSSNRNMTTRLMKCSFTLLIEKTMLIISMEGKCYTIIFLIIVHENTKTNMRTAETLRRRALQVDSCMALSIRFGFDINKPSPTTCIRKLNCKLFKRTEQKNGTNWSVVGASKLKTRKRMKRWHKYVQRHFIKHTQIDNYLDPSFSFSFFFADDRSLLLFSIFLP